MAEVQEQNGKYLVVFPTKEAAELHIESLKKQEASLKAQEDETASYTVEPKAQEDETASDRVEPTHQSLGAKFKNLVERLKMHGIHDADKPVAAATTEVPELPATPAVPGEPSKPPVVTETKPIVIEQPADASVGSGTNEDEKAEVLAAEETK